MSTPEKQNEAGTVLLTTLLVMAVMAAITVALMDDIRVAVRRTINVNAYAQADWQARGAEDFIRAWLRTDFAALDDTAQNVFLRTGEPVTLPTQDGIITVRIKDASHCFNLNSVLDFENKITLSPAEFVTLMELLGIPQNQAQTISQSLVDWIDADQNPRTGGAEDGIYLRSNPPYRTADTALTGPEEIRALNGMDEDLWGLLRPFVCVGPIGELSPVNINSVEIERIAVLAAALGEENGVEAAQQLLGERPPQGFAEDALKTAISGLQIEGLSETDRVSTKVSSVFIEVITTVGAAERIRTYRYDGVDTDEPVLTYRGWGRETFRVEIEKESVR